jgi:hypothetical protein
VAGVSVSDGAQSAQPRRPHTANCPNNGLPPLLAVAPGAVILIVTNPVEVISYAAQ